MSTPHHHDHPRPAVGGGRATEPDDDASGLGVEHRAQQFALGRVPEGKRARPAKARPQAKAPTRVRRVRSPSRSAASASA